MATVTAPESKTEQSKPNRERLPVPHSLNLKFSELRDYWKPIYDQHGPRVWGYLFRYFPRIIKPKPHYIDKFSEPLEDENQILQKWGTGEYEIRLYDMDVKRGNELCRCRFKFADSYTERPPVLDPLELDVGHSDNRSYLEWRRSNNMPVPGDVNRNGGQGNDGNAIAVKALADIASKKQEPAETFESEAASAAFKLVAQASNHAIETVKAQADPSAMLKIVDAVKGSGNQNAELFTTMLKLQSDAAANQTALITKLLDRPKENNNELIAVIINSQTAMTKSVFELLAAQKKNEGSGGIREAVETIAGIADLIGGGGRPRGNGGWVDSLLSNPMVNRLGDYIGTAAVNWSQAHMMQQAAQRQPGAIPMPAGRGPTPTPDGTVIYPGEPVGQQPPPGSPPTEDMLSQQFLIDFFMPRTAAFMNAIERGERGDEFAQRLFEIDDLIPELGGMTIGQHATIKSIGKDKLISLLGMAAIADPRLRQMLAGRQTLVYQFIEQFLSWEAAEEVPPPPEMEDKD